MQILDEGSLAGTLWNLEEARWARVAADSPGARAALDWVSGRQGVPGAYAGILFAPTSADLASRAALPTGENAGMGVGGTRHILGEEAVRALLLWGRDSGWDREKVLSTIAEQFRSGFRSNDPTRAGRWCCNRCTVARWRAVAAGRPAGWEEILADGLRLLADQPTTGAGRWKGYPFYYTLLALAEMPLPEAEAERLRMGPAAETLLRRPAPQGAAGRFRRRGLEWAVR